MSFKQFKKQYLDSTNISNTDSLLRAVNNIQGNIADALSPLISKIQNDSIIISNINLIAGQVNNVNTLLNRSLIGWRVIDINANANVWRVEDTFNTNLILYLRCSANCTVKLEVF